MSAADLSVYQGANRNPFNYAKVEQLSRDSVTPWLTLAEMRDQVNLYGDTSQDDYLSQLEVGVRQYIEDYLGMPIFPIQYRVYYDAGSLYGVPLSLDLPAVSQNFYANQSGVSVKAVKYWNASNVLTTVPVANYYYDQSGDKVIVTTLPTDISTDRTSPVFCDYTVVANPIADYPVIRQAGLMLLTHWYNIRTSVAEKIMRDVPFSFHALLRAYKPLVL
jgi:hypothetical protein